jgi:hypothetical protein
MSRIIKGPKNMCYNCWYTWYPRGKNISRNCPYCGSNRTGLDIIDDTIGNCTDDSSLIQSHSL